MIWFIALLSCFLHYQLFRILIPIADFCVIHIRLPGEVKICKCNGLSFFENLTALWNHRTAVLFVREFPESTATDPNQMWGSFRQVIT